ncbi:hypothetical protein [Pediococcus argentinicus]|nr:hypothetical protein [Pediococcus argentinicus]NKZ22098.1 hypothetical protein [Pediococcus argentinicus]GEP20088.1 hypothetical protein LSA03_14720 [Pediococcus argentinicus]
MPENETRASYKKNKKVQESSTKKTVNDNTEDTSFETIDEERPAQRYNAEILAEERRKLLGKRLNWTIVELLIAIVIVYLILFFVG